VPAASVIAFNTSVVRAATTAILAVPTRIAPRVVGLKAAAHVESIIRGVIVEVLQGLSKLEVLPASGTRRRAPMKQSNLEAWQRYQTSSRPGNSGA
jgi:hypothetical protein